MRTQHLTKLKPGNIIMGIIWTLFSSIFVIVGLWITYTSIKKSMWKEVPCVVTELKVKANQKLDPPFQPITSYKYKFDNASYTGDQVSHGSDGEKDYEKLGGLLHKYRKGEIKVCYVNTKNPEEATLLKQSTFSLFFGIAFAAFGSFFVLIGIFMIRKGKDSGPITGSQNDTVGNRAAMIPFFSIFAIAGITAMFFMGKGAMKSKSSEDWQKTSAKVIWSRVVSVRGSDSTTYRPEIFYRYEFNGIKHRSNSYKVSKTSSSGRSSKQKIVSQYPRGREFTCYVNPEEPWQAVIEPKMGRGWLILLFPIPFLAVGIGGLVMMFIKKDTPSITTGQAILSGKDKSIRKVAHGEAVFTPGKKRLGWFLGAIAMAVFWNGIVSLFLGNVLSGWESGNPSWFETIFFIPFGLVGIAFILHIPYRFLAMFNPSPTVTLAESAIAIGTGTKVTWEIPSGAHKIKRFRIFLKGREEARYRRGTDTKTAVSTFYEYPIMDTQDPRESASGSTEILLSEQATDLMPSWKGKHNSIIWTLEIKGEIPTWPDVSESYTIIVSPSSLTTQA